MCLHEGYLLCYLQGEERESEKSTYQMMTATVLAAAEFVIGLLAGDEHRQLMSDKII